MQKQIEHQKSEEVTKDTDLTDNSVDSWSQLYNRYTRIVNNKRKTENFTKHVLGPVLTAMLPVNLQFLFSISPIGSSVYTLLFSVFVGLFIVSKTDYNQGSLVNIHAGLLYMILPTLFVVYSPLFYIISIIMGIMYIIER
jgi:hypothetical protein